MGGPGSGVSRKRKNLAKTFRLGGLAAADRRFTPVRHVLEGAEQVLEDGGGKDTASLLRVRMAHRVMHLDWILSQDELRLSQGQEIDRPAYIAAATTWLRYATTLGIARVAKPAESLHDYMRRKSALPAPPTGGSGE